MKRNPSSKRRRLRIGDAVQLDVIRIEKSKLLLQTLEPCR